MNYPLGIFAVIDKEGTPLAEALLKEIGGTFGLENINRQYAVVIKSGQLWQAYETDQYQFFIEGEIFFRKEELSSGLNFNQQFCENFSLDILPKIKGNFNAIIIGKKQPEAFILTGAHGLKPLFVHHRENQIFLSDDLRLLKRALPDLSFSELALMQLMLFNFPIGQQSFLEGVQLLDGGILLNKNNQYQGIKWYDTEASIQGVKLSKKEALIRLRQTLNQVIQQYTPKHSQSGLSLTGGFDGRTILSAIKARDNLQVYTFGSHESSDITVAKGICDQIGLQHHAFYIDEPYYDKFFIKEAQEFIERSNGIGTYERTHYLHAFHQLSGKVQFLLTGNAGSEVLRTILEGGIHVPQLAFDLLQSKDPIQSIRAAIDRNVILKSLNINVEKYIDPLYDSWCQLMGSFKNETSSYRAVYRFFLKESLRKWFGTEMRIENKYCPNRTPFLDEEFIEVLHQSPFSVAYQPFLSQNPIQRKIGQTTYAHILVKNDLPLAKINTNRGYSPHDITNLFAIPKIAWSFFTKKRRNRNENSYNQFETATLFFNHNLQNIPSDLAWLNKEQLISFFEKDGLWQKEIRDFSRVVCLALWHQELCTHHALKTRSLTMNE